MSTPATPAPGTPGNRKAKKTKAPRSHHDTVGVYLRIRPLKHDKPSLVKVDSQHVRTYPPDGSNEQIYSFTQVFDNARQSEMFDQVARPVVEEFVQSAKDGLIFTYGITGSGKTYTMEGTPSDPGLIYRSIDFIFNSIGAHQTPDGLIKKGPCNSYRLATEKSLYPNLRCPDTPSAIPSVIRWQNRARDNAHVSVDPNPYYTLFVSLIELYNRQVHDLFEDLEITVEKDRKRREIRTDERGMSYVANAVEIEVKSADEAVEYYTRGIKRRKIGSTALNQESSRGHCVLNLKLVQICKSFNDRNKSYDFDDSTIVSSQLCLVDLAGSERTKRSGATGGALHEAGNINNSLGALRKCIRALRDCEPALNIQYREYSLTRLFKSYFEGHGSVRMVLCVKPTTEDFHENTIAMDFGLLTQDVAVDYATPPKLLKRSGSRGYSILSEYFDKGHPLAEPDPNQTDLEFLGSCIERLKNNREKRRKYLEAALAAQNEVRQSILATMERNKNLQHEYEMRSQDIRHRDERLNLLESQCNSIKRSKQTMTDKIKDLERENRDLRAQHKRDEDSIQQYELRHAQNEKLYVELLNLLKTKQIQSDAIRRLIQLLRRMKPDEWATKPSAPELKPLQCSSPMSVERSQSPQSQSPPATTSSSSVEVADIPFKNLTRSPSKGGIPIVNPRHNRSLSCSNMQWIHHKPAGTIDTGTVLKPKLKNGRSVKNLSINDILRKDAGGYSVVHQNADSEGEVETFVYKGQIVSTACGGAQVTFNDVETMKQVSPKRRRRAASDAHYSR